MPRQMWGDTSAPPPRGFRNTELGEGHYNLRGTKQREALVQGRGGGKAGVMRRLKDMGTTGTQIGRGDKQVREKEYGETMRAGGCGQPDRDRPNVTNH